MIDLSNYQDIEGTIRITCVDGDVFEGQINYIDDPEESGIGEWGASFTTVDGRFLEIGESEISSIEVL